MMVRQFQLIVGLGLLAGCGGQSLVKPAEMLDERTGATVSALARPIELVERADNAAPAAGQRASFAYLGPVEWNRSGDITYGLWVHVAPGNDRQVGDIRARGAVSLQLDDGSMVLVPTDALHPGGSPYREVASWGQTAYYEFGVAALKKISASQSLVLVLRGADQSAVDFTPSHETRSTLMQFAHSRGISAD